ncbi:MAG: hypothetical protein P8046_04930 [Anaerolineales bacterium]|jgi:hypothetical protein
MNNKIAKKLIHFWILLASIFTLAVGWIALAHSDKPDVLPMFSTSTNVNVSMADIPSLASMVDGTANGAAQPASIKLNMNVAAMRLRTSGS